MNSKYGGHQYRKRSVLGMKQKILLTIFAIICVLYSVISLGVMFSPWLYGQGLAVWRKIDVTILNPDQQIDYEKPSFGMIMYELAKEKENEPIEIDKASLPFEIRIPDIGIESTVSANIDASDARDYGPALEKGVAHAYGSVFPGEGGMVYIFGHSTDYDWNVETYNALFYEVKDLEPGADVFLQLGDDIFSYKVKEQHVIAPDDIEFLKTYADQDVLLMQTCYPPGTTWQRLVVVADPVE